MLQIAAHDLLKRNFQALLGSYKATVLDEFWIGLLALEALLITSVLGFRVLEAIGRGGQTSRWSRSSFAAYT